MMPLLFGNSYKIKYTILRLQTTLRHFQYWHLFLPPQTHPGQIVCKMNI